MADKTKKKTKKKKKKKKKTRKKKRPKRLKNEGPDSTAGLRPVHIDFRIH